MRTSSVFSAVALLAVSIVSADESGSEVQSDLPCFNNICWTSWKCYYERASKWGDRPGDRCGLPNNVYRQGRDGAPWSTLVWGETYQMNWASAYTAQEDTIVLEWLMFEAPGTEKPIQANETDLFPDYRPTEPERFVVAHTQNISRSTDTWYFQPLLSFFPNADLNISSKEASHSALGRNIFRLYHPKTFNPRESKTYDLSEPFMVISPWEENMIKKAADNQKKAGKKQLVIGVAVGVAVAWVVAFLVSWFTSAWYQRRISEKRGFPLSPARLE